MGKMTLKLYVILFLGLFSMGARCQEVALKSNLLYDAFVTLNAGVEVGHFVGAHALGGQYNVGNLDNNLSFLGTDFSGISDNRYQGWFGGLGLVYGHSWILNKHWNLEALFGFGWVYTRYDVYPCAHCGTKVAEDKSHNYIGPTKAAINLVYTF